MNRRFPQPHHPDRRDDKYTKLAVYGTFIDAPNPGEVRVRKDTCIVIDRSSGRIESILKADDKTYRKLGYSDSEVEVVDLSSEPERVFIPGFVDTVSYRSP